MTFILLSGITFQFQIHSHFQIHSAVRHHFGLVVNGSALEI